MEACGNQINGSNTIEYLLPEGIITEILLRLPVKTLLRFKRVCKSWRTFISSPYFTKTHLKTSKNSKIFANHNVLLCSELKTFTCSLSSVFDNNVPRNPNRLYSPTSLRYYEELLIYGNCNGLLCVQGDNSTLVLYNPCTRKSKILPASGTNIKSNSLLRYGLCYHELDDDYKVVEVYVISDDNNEDAKVKVYSLKTNSWRKIKGDGVKPTNYSRLCEKLPGLPVGGVLHWALRDADNIGLCQIFVVDTVTDKHGTLAGPKYFGKHDLEFWAIMDFRGCLGVRHAMKHKAVDIWMMKESWTKVFSVPCSGYYWAPIGLKDGEILVSSYRYLLVYNSRDGSSIELEVPGHLYFPRSSRPPFYIESLVDPSFDGE